MSVNSPKKADIERRHRKRGRASSTSPYFAKRNLSVSRTRDIRGAHHTISYSPPQSPYSLIQEKLYRNPWQLLIATMFLNKTNGTAALPVFWRFIERFKNPEDVLKSDVGEMSAFLQPLGLHHIRATRIMRFCEEFLRKPWKYPIELHGIGKYGNDSYRIFCLGQWKKVCPNDHKLTLYHDWLIEQNNLGLLDNSI